MFIPKKSEAALCITLRIDFGTGISENNSQNLGLTEIKVK
jgi:hypothetical protein